MLDASKYAADAGLLDRDPLGNMFDLPHWSPRRAEALATAEGIVLEEDHWLVIYALREHHRAHGSCNARTLGLYLAQEVSPDGRRWLYRLFPGGPVRQASRIAGLPEPADSSDRSFGSVQ